LKNRERTGISGIRHEDAGEADFRRTRLRPHRFPAGQAEMIPGNPRQSPSSERILKEETGLEGALDEKIPFQHLRNGIFIAYKKTASERESDLRRFFSCRKKRDFIFV